MYNELLTENEELIADLKDALYDAREKLKNAIIVPPNATNGDAFLVMHPNVVATKIHKEGNLFDVVQLRMKGDTIPFAEIYTDWWDAPYKEGKVKESMYL